MLRNHSSNLYTFCLWRPSRLRNHFDFFPRKKGLSKTLLSRTPITHEFHLITSVFCPSSISSLSNSYCKFAVFVRIFVIRYLQ